MKTKIKIFKNNQLMSVTHNLTTDKGLELLCQNQVINPYLYLSTNSQTPQSDEDMIYNYEDFGEFKIQNPGIDRYSNDIINITYSINLPGGAIPQGLYYSVGIGTHQHKVSRALFINQTNEVQPIVIDDKDSIFVEYSFQVTRPVKQVLNNVTIYACNVARDGIMYQGDWRDVCGSIQDNTNYNNVYELDDTPIINNVTKLNITGDNNLGHIDMTITNNTSQTQVYTALSVCVCSVQYYLVPDQPIILNPGISANFKYSAKVGA